MWLIPILTVILSPASDCLKAKNTRAAAHRAGIEPCLMSHLQPAAGYTANLHRQPKVPGAGGLLQELEGREGEGCYKERILLIAWH